eukprot:12923667-Alexandrium_andersonii.AAC.1
MMRQQVATLTSIRRRWRWSSSPCDLTKTLAASPSDSPAACHGNRGASWPAGAAGGLPGGGVP